MERNIARYFVTSIVPVVARFRRVVCDITLPVREISLPLSEISLTLSDKSLSLSEISLSLNEKLVKLQNTRPTITTQQIIVASHRKTDEHGFLCKQGKSAPNLHMSKE